MAYNAIVGLLLFVLGVVLVAFLAAGLVCTTAPILGTPVTLGSWGSSTQSPVTVAAVVIIGTILVLAVPPTARVVAYADARIAIALLGRARTEDSRNGSSIWTRLARGRSTRPIRNDAGSNATCMTGPSNASPPWP